MTAVARANCGGRRAGGGSPCQTAASAAAAISVVLVILVVAADASVSTAPAGDAPAAATPLRTAVREPAAAGRADNASADPITAAWEANLRETAAAALPPLPSARLFRRHAGLFTLHAGVGLAAGQALLEVSKAQLDVPFVLATEFSALDARMSVSVETHNRRQEVLGQSPDRIFAFRLAPDTTPATLQLYRPPLHKRSVDPTSEPGTQAMAGISTLTVQSFAGRPIGNGRLLIDVGPWVAAGFMLPAFDGWSTHFVSGAAHPQQVTFSVEAADPAGLGGSLKVTAVGLPRQRMTPRPLDDRIGYLATRYSWVDDYESTKTKAFGAYILKWDLAKHPVIKYYVDPSVPRAFWPAVVEGITRWNPAFVAAGHRRAVLRAVVPTDRDWPADYAADDARFNTVSFVPADHETAIGATKTDPRTGEILNADVTLPDDMLRLFARLYRLWFEGDGEGRATSRADVAGVGASSRDSRSASSAGGRVAGSEEDYVHQQVAAFATHEVGHTLGLRHNYRGSAGIPWSQLTNTTYVETHGLTTSVMDYLAAQPLPRAKDGSPQRYFATPVLGAYDVAAIRYGYTDWRSDDEARAFAESVAASGLALGSDWDSSTDALTEQFDMSATPLEWYRHLVRTAQRRLRRLTRTASRRPSTSAADLSTDAQELFGAGVNAIRSAAKLVGGAVTDRSRTGGGPAVTPLDADTEAAAARWVLAQLDPDHGLLSAATVSTVGPHLVGNSAPECADVATCLARRPVPIATILHRYRVAVLKTLLSPKRLARLDANVAAAAATRGGDRRRRRRRLSVAGLLAATSKTFFGPRWADLRQPATARGASPFRAEAQAGWVEFLADLVHSDGDVERPPSVAVAAAGELSRLAEAVAAAAASAPDSTHLRGLRLLTADYRVA